MANPATKHLGYLPRLEKLAQAGGLAMAVVKKAAVAVDPGIGSLLEDFCEEPGRKSRDEGGARGVLHAMDRPEDLLQAVEFDDVARLLARVIGGEAAMVGRMPVLRCYDQVEVWLQPVHHGYHSISLRHRQRAAGNEIVLNIGKDESVHKTKLPHPQCGENIKQGRLACLA